MTRGCTIYTGNINSAGIGIIGTTLLPQKMHKTQNGIRPIVSSVNSIIKNTSMLIDHLLQPIVKSLTSYIKYTTEFVNQSAEIENMLSSRIDVTKQNT